MKILHIVYSWKPSRGGIISFVNDLVQQQSQQNHVSILIIEQFITRNKLQFDNKRINYIIPDITINTLVHGDPNLDYNNPSIDQKILDEVKRINPDIVHIHSFTGISSRIVPLFEKENYRSIIHIHDYLAVCPRMDLFYKDEEKCFFAGEKCSTCLNTNYSNADYEKRLIENIKNYNCASKIIGVSSFVIEKYKKYGLKLEKCKIVHNGISNSIKRRQILPFKRKLRCKLHLVHISSCAPKKGVIYLAEAVMSLPKDIKRRIKLEIHGARSIMYKKLKDICGDDENIKIYPPYTRETVGKVLANSDVAVLPSLWWEPFGLTVLESFAMGLPVIGSLESGMSEIITNYYNGILIDTNNYEQLRSIIMELVRSNELLVKLKENVKKTHIKRMNEVAKEIQEIYESV